MNDLPTTILGARQYRNSHAPLVFAQVWLDPVDAASSTTLSTRSESNSATAETTSKKGLSTAEKVGIGVGSGGLVLIVCLIAIIFVHRRRVKSGDIEKGRTRKPKSRRRFRNRRRMKHKIDMPSSGEPKALHSPSTTRSAPLEVGGGGSPAPSPPRSPPPIRPKSSKRPPSLPIVPVVSIDDSESLALKTPDVPAKSSRRLSLLMEEVPRPRTAPAAAAPPEHGTPLFSDASRSPGNSSLRPLPLFSPPPELLGRISEDSRERSGNHTPQVPAKAAARMSMVSTTSTMIDGAEEEIATLRAENERLRRETLRLRAMVGDNRRDE
ncbi:hypothetical protein MKZ38_007091 [Zalerion maritima]|uniref:Uncharacterized protein n=1 Tax=Zalerion maritima TaxID=339359 RepID=A0AAD5RI73_9PEZI|nr:hypothetical protein MKZ38_007091 [Zalerion maritima]